MSGSESDKAVPGKDLPRILASLSSLRKLDLSVLETEVITRLATGRRTRNELVEEIYQTNKESPDYVANYTKVRRALQVLQSRGYVSTPLFSKEKPYRLTPYAVQTLASIAPGMRPPTLVSKVDAAAYAACILAGIAAYWAATRDGAGSDRVLAILPASFFVLFGFSIARIWEVLRKVI